MDVQEIPVIIPNSGVQWNDSNPKMPVTGSALLKLRSLCNYIAYINTTEVGSSIIIVSGYGLDDRAIEV
jgi:hypothetical protein